MAARGRRLNLPDYVPYLVNRLGAALVARFSEDALAPHDLSIAMWRVLVTVSHLGPQRQIDLAAATSVDVSTLSRLITRLVQMGLVTRSRSATSSREVTVRLTARAESLVNELVPIAQALERTAIEGLSQAELAVAKDCLRRMYENLRPAGAEPDRAAPQRPARRGAGRESARGVD
jgi:DNA-binding MarR family transcriptional regulator